MLFKGLMTNWFGFLTEQAADDKDYFDATLGTQEGVGLETQLCPALTSFDQCKWNPKSCEFNSITEFNINGTIVCDKEVSETSSIL